MSDLEPRIGITVRLRGRLVADFFQVKTHLGLESNPDVIRHLIHKQARVLRRRTLRRPSPAAQAADPSPPAALDSSEPVEDCPPDPVDVQSLCLSCPLPDCDESDPRCLYQQATGERRDRLEQMRAYSQRTRAST